MSEGFDKLKDIGAQKIHESTHISRKYIQDILQEDFSGMNRIQFLAPLALCISINQSSPDPLCGQYTFSF